MLLVDVHVPWEKSKKETKPGKDEPKNDHPNFRQLYLLFHHVGFYFYAIARSGFVMSFLSDYPFLYYVILFLCCLSLEVYSFACGNPGWVTEEPANTEGLFYCEVCKRHCPVRASHCRTCKRCIHRRDHHCPWTGRCVGRDNHAMFLLFLLIECVLMLIVNYDIFRSLAVSKPWRVWIRDNAGCLVIALLCFFDCFLVGMLALGNINRAVHNVSVWEMLRRDMISYMKDVPIDRSPFDKGTWENILEFATNAYAKRTWELPAPPTLDQIVHEKMTACEELGIDPELVMPQAMENVITLGKPVTS